jgi:hypothetical protein
VVYWRPLGVVQVKVPSGCCSLQGAQGQMLGLNC